MDDWLRDNIREIFPALPEQSLINVQEKLEECGVEAVEDLESIKEEDLIGILPVIKCRKLVKAWKHPQMQGTEPSVVPGPSAPPTAGKDLPGPSAPQSKGRVPDQTTMSSAWFLDYKIPWQSFSRGFLNACDEGHYPEKKHVNHMIRTLMDDINCVCQKPKRSELRAVVTKIVAKYPQLRASVGATIIGDGTSTLLAKLEARRDNNDRPCKRKAAELVNVMDSEHEQAVQVTKDSYGCILEMVQPPLPDGETQETQNQKKVALQSQYVDQTWDDRKVDELMEQTYATQRALIGDKCVDEVLNEFPFLGEERWLLKHFSMLTGLNTTELTSKVAIKARKLHTYFLAQPKKTSKMTDLLIEIKTESVAAKNITPIINGTIHLLACYFQENIDDLVRCYKDTGGTCTEVEEDKESPLTPFIAVIGNLHHASRIELIADKQPISVNITSMGKALVCLLATYFNFGIEYPKTVPNTLDFIQRHIMELNPPRGSKVRKGKQHGLIVSNRVVQLAQKLTNFESVWIDQQEQ